MKTGKLRYIVRDFPVESIHPHAFKAAEATHCARDQGKYWEMHDLLFSNQRALGASDLANHARALGLDAGVFQTCLASGKHATRIRRDLAEGEKGGVRGTPTFMLGATDSGATVRVLRLIRGAQPASAFKAAIDGVLATSK